jgi:flagellar basal-body rod modification protein FlgD
MSTGSVPAASSSSSSSSSDAATNNALTSLESVNTSQFLQMMIAELQNQDPMDPTSTSDIMTQLSQMQQIASTNQLSTTLNGLAVGQSVSSGSALLGATVAGLDVNGAAANGVVSSVSIANGAATLQVGTQSVPLANVTSITSKSNSLASLLSGLGSSSSGTPTGTSGA